MANCIMEEGSGHEPQSGSGDNGVVISGTMEAAAQEPCPSTKTRKSGRKKPSRTPSRGGVRRILEKQFQSIRHLMNDKDDVKTARQWSQRLQSHLQAKTEQGPSQHQRSLLFHTNDGEDQEEQGSNPNLLVRLDELDTKQGSSSRLEQSMSAAEIGSSWLVSPAAKTTCSRNNSQNSGSYSYLDSQPRVHQLKSRSPRRGNDDSRLKISPPPPLPDISLSNNATFSGGTHFDLPIGPSATDAPEHELPMHQPQDSSSDSPQQKQPYKLPQSRKSLFAKGRPILAPKLAKQLTDFRLRRQGKATKPEDDEDTVNFSVTTENFGGNSGHEDIVASDEGDDPARESSYIRKMNASGTFQHVEELLANQLHRSELNNEIELRREKFKGKLLAASSLIVSKEGSNEEQRLETSSSGLYIGIRHDNDAVVVGTKKKTKCTGKRPTRARSTSSAYAKKTMMLEDTSDKRQQPRVKPTGKRPTRAQSTTVESARRKSLADEVEEIMRQQRQEEEEETDDIRHRTDDALMFDDDDANFFGNQGADKKKKTKKSANSTSNSGDTPVSFETTRASGRRASNESPPCLDLCPLPGNLTRARTTSDVKTAKHSSMIPGQTTISIRPAIHTNPNSSAAMTSASNRFNRTVSQQGEKSVGSGSERTSLSVRSSGSNGDNGTIASGGSVLTNGSQKSSNSQQSAGLPPPTLRRRATVATEIDLEQSFQIRDGEFVLSSGRKGGTNDGSSSNGSTKTDSSGKKKRKKNMFEANFTTDVDKGPTGLFHQSFAVESSSVPPRGEKLPSCGSSMPAIVLDKPNILDMTTALLSTVEEVSSRDGAPVDQKPKRRNSLPTGSSHGTLISKGMLLTPTLSKPKLGKAPSSATERTPGRSRRRHSITTPDLEASIAHLRVDVDGVPTLTTKSKSAASLATSNTPGSRSKQEDASSKAGSTASSTRVTPEEELALASATKRMGLAPPPADSATPRRRTSISAAPVQPEYVPDPTVEKIRMRRISTRVASSSDKRATRKSLAASCTTIDWQRRSSTTQGQSETMVSELTSTKRSGKAKRIMKDNSESAVTQRRKERMARRTTSASATFRRTATHDGSVGDSNTKDSLTRRATEMKDDSKKKRISTRSGTPSGARRHRRPTGQSEATPGTPRQRRRTIADRASNVEEATASDRSPKPRFLSASPRALRSKCMDESNESQTGRATPSSLRRNARPRRQGSIDDESTRSNMSDDSWYEPTPKPAAPPALPMLPARPCMTESSGRLSLRPRRGSNEKILPRRHKSDYGKGEGAVAEAMTPNQRRKHRNRRHTAHEALQGNGTSCILPPDLCGMTKTGDRPPIRFAEKEAAKTRRTMDKKLMVELNKASRFQRRKTAKEDDMGDGTGQGVDEANEKIKPTRARSNRKSRRSKSDDGVATPDSPMQTYRQRKTETGVDAATQLRNRLRRVKTVDGVFSKGIAGAHSATKRTNDSQARKEDVAVTVGEADKGETADAAAEVQTQGKGGLSPPQELGGNASRRLMLNGLSF